MTQIHDFTPGHLKFRLGRRRVIAAQTCAICGLVQREHEKAQRQAVKAVQQRTAAPAGLEGQ